MGWDFRPLAFGHRLSSFRVPEMACGSPVDHAPRESPPSDGVRDQEPVLVTRPARFPRTADFMMTGLGPSHPFLRWADIRLLPLYRSSRSVMMSPTSHGVGAVAARTASVPGVK